VRLWPAIALVGAYELLTMIIRRVQVPTAMPSLHDDACVADPLDERAAQVFAVELAADRVPSIRSIRATLHVGQRRTATEQIPRHNRQDAWPTPRRISGGPTACFDCLRPIR
jgi:hypothetical protein